MNIGLELHRLRHHVGLLKRWWLRPPTAYQPLFVVASCRSGSNLLLSLLRQQPGVNMRGELLYPGTPFGIPRYKVSRTRAIWHLRASLHAEREPIRGCKLMTYQLRNCKLNMPLVHRAFPTAKYIVLYRQDLGAQFVSQKLAEATNQFMLRPGQQAKSAQVRIDAEELRRYVEQMQYDYRRIIDNSWLKDCGVLLSYEELAGNPDYWLRAEICPLLDVPFVKPRAELLKQNSLPLSEMISNYSEIRTLLASCRHRYFWKTPQRQAA